MLITGAGQLRISASLAAAVWIITVAWHVIVLDATMKENSVTFTVSFIVLYHNLRRSKHCYNYVHMNTIQNFICIYFNCLTVHSKSLKNAVLSFVTPLNINIKH